MPCTGLMSRQGRCGYQVYLPAIPCNRKLERSKIERRRIERRWLDRLSPRRWKTPGVLPSPGKPRPAFSWPRHTYTQFARPCGVPSALLCAAISISKRPGGITPARRQVPTSPHTTQVLHTSKIAWARLERASRFTVEARSIPIELPAVKDPLASAGGSLGMPRMQPPACVAGQLKYQLRRISRL